MFRSRANEKDMAKRHGNMASNKDVSVPLVHTQDGRDFDPKRKASHDTISGNEEDAETKEAVQAQESKRRKRRIMKIAVYFMFGIIALGVFAIWLFHKDSVESLRFDSDFIFTVKLRSLEVKNSEGDSVLYGDMGRQLLATPYDHCWDRLFDNYEENCLYWRKIARLRVSRDDNSTSSCYTLHWEGLAAGFQAEDCFYLQRYTWFGYITNTTPIWPISDIHLNYAEYYPLYPESQNEHLVPLWFGSQGVSIFIDSSYPFSTSWNITDKRQFCIRSTIKSTGELAPTDLIKYTICKADSLHNIYAVTQKHRQEADTEFSSLASNHNQLFPKPILSLLSKEDISPWLYNQSSEYSLLEIYDGWEREFGDLEIGQDMHDLKDLTRRTLSQDIHLILPISMFFSYNSKHFREGVSKGFFVQDNLNMATRMVQWRGHEGAVLDFSNPLATEWFLEIMGSLATEYNAQAFKMLHINIPQDSSFHDPNITNLDYTRLFTKNMANLNGTSLIQEVATGFIPLPVQTPISMPFQGETGSACMNTTISETLIMGMSGFHLVIATTDSSWNTGAVTDERLKRWLQLAIFFPILKLPTIPILKDQNVQGFMNGLLELRQQTLLPYITQVRVDEPNDPLIRPLWWVAPDDEQALTINDQFMVGNRLLVAPILCENMDKKQVYLPKGKWRSIEKGILQGPQTLDYLINGTKPTSIPYFWKIVETGENEGSENYL